MARTGRSVIVWFPVAVLTTVVVTCFLGPLAWHLPPPVGGDIGSADLPFFSPHHLFGTDMIGNDVLSRVLAGGRVSIGVAVVSNAIGVVLGGGLGMLAALGGGRVEYLVSVVLDVLIAFPSLVLALVIAAYLGPGEPNVILALSFFSVPTYARLTRAHTLHVLEQDFIRAAQLFGVRPVRLVITHVAPNVAPQILTVGYLVLPVTIMFEASLGFLGLGVRPPAPSWGNMIARGQESLTSDPRLVLLPSAFLVLTVVSLTVLGDSFRVRLARR